jgi:hypothetical protein
MTVLGGDNIPRFENKLANTLIASSESPAGFFCVGRWGLATYFARVAVTEGKHNDETGGKKEDQAAQSNGMPLARK